jgi:hypothetical protein
MPYPDSRPTARSRFSAPTPLNVPFHSGSAIEKYESSLGHRFQGETSRHGALVYGALVYKRADFLSRWIRFSDLLNQNRRPLTPTTSPRLLAATLAVACVALTIAGCSGARDATVTPGLPDAFPDHTSQQIYAQIATASDTLHSFRAKAKMTVRSPEQNGSFNAEVRQVRDDSLWMRMSRFGFEGARVLVTSDSFFVHNRLQNHLMVGSVAEAQTLLAAPVTSDEAFRNMLGLIVPEPNVDWTVRADSSLYYLKDPSGQHSYVVDPKHWRVTRYARTDESGNVIEERLFGEFTSVGGVSLPQRVVFRNRQQDALAMLAYESLSLNPNRLSFDFHVPSGTRRVQLPSR